MARHAHKGTAGGRACRRRRCCRRPRITGRRAWDLSTCCPDACCLLPRPVFGRSAGAAPPPLTFARWEEEARQRAGGLHAGVVDLQRSRGRVCGCASAGLAAQSRGARQFRTWPAARAAKPSRIAPVTRRISNGGADCKGERSERVLCRASSPPWTATRLLFDSEAPAIPRYHASIGSGRHVKPSSSGTAPGGQGVGAAAARQHQSTGAMCHHKRYLLPRCEERDFEPHPIRFGC